MLDNFYSQGYSTEEIARKIVNERNANRLNSYLERGDIEGYEMARKDLRLFVDLVYFFIKEHDADKMINLNLGIKEW